MSDQQVIKQIPEARDAPASPQVDLLQLEDVAEHFRRRFKDARLSPKQRIYLAALALHGVRTRAAKIAQIDYSLPFKWKDPKNAKNAEAYVEAEEIAMQMSADVLEDVAVQRSVHGWLDPIVHEGEIVGYKRRFDGTLLQMLLKSRRPEKFNPTLQHRHSGAVTTKLVRIVDGDTDEPEPD